MRDKNSLYKKNFEQYSEKNAENVKKQKSD